MATQESGTVAVLAEKPSVARDIASVLILTTSKAEEDIFKAYDLGVNSFIVKPVTFQSLVDLTLALNKYWFEIVELPSRHRKVA